MRIYKISYFKAPILNDNHIVIDLITIAIKIQCRAKESYL